MKEAMFCEGVSDNQVRENRGGTLYTLIYGRTIARHVDPVEKKPVFNFYGNRNG